MIATAPANLATFVEQPFLKPVVDSVTSALAMCNTQARLVGMSTIPTEDRGLVTGMVGVHGKVSGFITVNIAERFAIRLVEGLVQDTFGKLSLQVVDGVGELTNIIAGGIKSGLSSTPWGFANITVPSVIVGQGFQFAYARGLSFVSVRFEHADSEALMLGDRLMDVSLSLLRL